MRPIKIRVGWSGNVIIGTGLGIFEGFAGDNEEHRHWAHQLTIGRSNEVSLLSGGKRYRSAAIFVRANTPHRLEPGPVLSIYMDPTISVAKRFCQRLNESASIEALTDLDIQWLFDRPILSISAVEIFSLLKHMDSVDNRQPDNLRLQVVLAAIDGATRGHREVERGELAAIVSLSPSRFSHWFRQQTGMPLRSYKKWLRLIHGMNLVLQGYNLTDAAHDSCFSDQAHFSRTFFQAFGVSPSNAVAHIKSTALPHM